MLSTSAKATVLNGLVGNTQNGIVSGRAYIGLSSSAPNSDGTVSGEPEGNGYARVQIGYYNDSLNRPMSVADGQAKNSKELHFNKATGSWGTLTHLCIFSSATSNTAVAWGELDEPLTPEAGSVVVIEAEGLVITIQ